MTKKQNDLCIPVDKHDYEQDPLPEASDEFVSLAEAGPGNDPARVGPDDLLEEHVGD